MKKLLLGVFTVLVLAITIYITLPVLSLNFIHLPVILLGLSIFVLAIAFVNGVPKAENDKYRLTLFQKFSYVFLGITTLIVVIGFVSTFSLFNWKTKQVELNIVESKNFDTSVPNVDMKNLILLDEENALRSCERLITETNPTLGSQFQIGEGTLTVVENKPYWVFPLEYRGFFKWLSTKGEIPGFIKISATNATDATFVEFPYNLSPSGLFSSDLKRAVYLKYPQYGLTDMSFEVDDNGEGRWVITAYSNKNWLATPYVKGSIVVNPATGEMTFYEVNKQPKWVNRVFSTDFFESQLDWYGKYIGGWWNPSDKGKLQSTEGMGYVFKENELYFYTGITSVGKDSATTGFIIYNPRNGEAVYNKVSGSIETRAMAAMEELVQNAGYKATFPYLINLNGEATYFSTLKGNSGNIVGYAFASVENYKALAQGPTLREAQSAYAKSLLREGGANSLAEQSDQAEKVSGVVSRVGALNESDFALKFIGDNRLFIVSTEQYPMIALTKEGDKVKITYIETTDTERVDALTFENQSIQ